MTSIAVEPDDLVLVTTGSQVADLSTGSMSQAPGPPPNSGRSVALWKRLAQARADFGNPDVFFDPAKAPDSRWVTFTVTTTGTEFLDEMKKLTGSETGRGGVVTLRDSAWVLSADDLPPARSPRPVPGHERLVGLRPASGMQRRLRRQTHG